MTVPALTLRRATAEDLPAMHALVESSFRGPTAEKGWCSEAEFFTSARITADEVLAKFNNPSTVMFLGHDAAGALVTCCEIVKKDADTGYFGLFAVDPEKQGGGIGSYVLAEAERHARDTMGCRRMEMQVIAQRDTLIAYYVRRGYQQSKETRPFPYHAFEKGSILKDDLCFAVLNKDLTA